MRDELADVEVAQRLTGRLRDFLHQAEAPLRIDERPVLLAPRRGGQHEMRFARRLGRVIHVLHDEKIELLENARELVLVNPRMGGVGGDDPQPLDLPIRDALHDLIVGEAVLRGHAGLVEVENSRHLAAMLRVQEVMSAEQIRRVAEQPRAHRVALAGDGVRAGAGPPDVAGHQREIDDGLRGARSFVALVHAHRPPEGDALALVNRLCQPVQLGHADAARCRDAFWRELFHEPGKAIVTRRVRGDVGGIDPAALNQEIRDAVEQDEIGLGLERVMLRRGHRSLGLTRIDDNDLRPVFVPQHALPHDRMRNAEVGTDEDDHI